MSKRSSRLLSRLAPIVLAFISGCAAASTSEPPPGPDAGPIVIDPAGTFRVRSSFTLQAAPNEVASVLGELRDATDGRDDPSRYLVELVVARLPEGQTRTIAQLLAPYVAAYVNDQIAVVAPRLSPGLRALASGISRLATRFGTLEQLRVDPDGWAQRTIDGFQLDGDDLWCSTLGLEEITAETTAVLAGARLELRPHATMVPYGALIRLGLDRVVIPRLVPEAADLARALRALVDCAQLGELIAGRIGLGSPSLYEEACVVGLTVAAARIYDALPAVDAPPLALEVTGTARAADRDGDAVMDALEAGTWTGSFDQGALGSSSFEGTSR